jgi:hypothetical protein
VRGSEARSRARAGGRVLELGSEEEEAAGEGLRGVGGREGRKRGKRRGARSEGNWSFRGDCEFMVWTGAAVALVLHWRNRGKNVKQKSLSSYVSICFIVLFVRKNCLELVWQQREKNSREDIHQRDFRCH